MAGLDQRLTVFGDGRVALDDRKARASSQTAASAAEIESLKAALGAVDADRWKGLIGALARGLAPRPHESMRFEVRCDQGRIAGHAGRHDEDLAPVLAELDELLARAVRERRG
jgi:hypothetical protein